MFSTSITTSDFMPSDITFTDVDNSNSSYTYILYNSSRGIVNSGNYTYGVDLSENLVDGDYSIEIVKTKSYSFTIDNPLNDPEYISSNIPINYTNGTISFSDTYLNFPQNTILATQLVNLNGTDITNKTLYSFDSNLSMNYSFNGLTSGAYAFQKTFYHYNGTELSGWTDAFYD